VHFFGGLNSQVRPRARQGSKQSAVHRADNVLPKSASGSHEDFIEAATPGRPALSVHETEPESVIVRDIMTRPVITAKESDTAADVAKLMAKHNIGCVLVSGKKGETIGIITERDIVQRMENSRES
jgi:hypothetical protein